jgi:hypothetical protein
VTLTVPTDAVVFEDRVAFTGDYVAILTCPKAEDVDEAASAECLIHIHKLYGNTEKAQTVLDFVGEELKGTDGLTFKHPCPYNPTRPKSTARFSIACMKLDEERITVKVPVPYGASGMTYDADSNMLLLTFNTAYKEFKETTAGFDITPLGAVMRIRLVRVHVLRELCQLVATCCGVHASCRLH